MRKTLTHKPSGAKLILDSSEIFPDDPGNGTPAIVEYGGGTATCTFALGEGVVYRDRGGDIELPRSVIDWLLCPQVDNEIEAMYNAGRNGNW